MDESTPTTKVVARTGTGPMVRIGLVGIAAAALIAVAILAIGATAGPSGILAAGAGSSAAPGASDDVDGPNGHGGPGRAGLLGKLGDHLFGTITITAISGNDISLQTVDGWTRTITVDSGTTYMKGGQSIALSDLQIGDEIAFKQTRESDSSFTIDGIVVILPHAAGEVTAVSGSTITLKTRDGGTSTITVTGTTTYTVNGATASLGDVKVGMVLIAEGTKNADGSLSATRVRAAALSNIEGRGFGHRKFRAGPNGGGGTSPDATTAPSATGSAS